jgi:hypothetical protein
MTTYPHWRYARTNSRIPAEQCAGYRSAEDRDGAVIIV